MKTLFSIALAVSIPVHAIVIVGSGDPTANTSAPTLPGFENCGWDLVGQWGAFTGVPISPHYFITASHVSGSIGMALIFEGVSYPAISVNVDQFSDFTLWKVDKPFPCFAQRYFGNDEEGKTVVMIGRGTQRGSTVTANCPITRVKTVIVPGIHPGWIAGRAPVEAFNPAWGDQRIRTTNQIDNFHLVGWNYGPSDSVMRWGTNVVKAQFGSHIYTAFNGDGGFNTCAVSTGDSSGAVFIKDTDGVWKLDAIIHQTSGLNLFIDGRGFGGGCEGTTPIMTGAYSSRLNYRLNWIESIIGNDK